MGRMSRPGASAPPPQWESESQTSTVRRSLPMKAPSWCQVGADSFSLRSTHLLKESAGGSPRYSAMASVDARVLEELEQLDHDARRVGHEHAADLLHPQALHLGIARGRLERAGTTRGRTVGGPSSTMRSRASRAATTCSRRASACASGWKPRTMRQPWWRIAPPSVAASRSSRAISGGSTTPGKGSASWRGQVSRPGRSVTSVEGQVAESAGSALRSPRRGRGGWRRCSRSTASAWRPSATARSASARRARPVGGVDRRSFGCGSVSWALEGRRGRMWGQHYCLTRSGTGPRRTCPAARPPSCDPLVHDTRHARHHGPRSGTSAPTTALAPMRASRPIDRTPSITEPVPMRAPARIVRRSGPRRDRAPREEDDQAIDVDRSRDRDLAVREVGAGCHHHLGTDVELGQEHGQAMGDRREDGDAPAPERGFEAMAHLGEEGVADQRQPASPRARVGAGR